MLKARNTSSFTNLLPIDWFQEDKRLNKPNEPTQELNNDGTADLFLPNGEKMNVTLDAQGMMAARQATMSNLMFAAR